MIASFALIARDPTLRLIALLMALFGAINSSTFPYQSMVAIDRIAQRRPLPMLYGAALATALVLLVAQVGFGIAQDQILFSGQSGMTALVQETSVTAVVVILVCKGIAYAVALGGGLRGGPIFPATFLGVAVGVLVSLLLPAESVSPMAAAGVSTPWRSASRSRSSTRRVTGFGCRSSGPAVSASSPHSKHGARLPGGGAGLRRVGLRWRGYRKALQ